MPQIWSTPSATADCCGPTTTTIRVSARPGRASAAPAARAERDDQASQREDRIVASDHLVRLGIASKTGVHLGWTAYGRDRTRNKATGAIDAIDAIRGMGDLRFAVRQHLAREKGESFSAGVEAFVTAPTGKYPVGDDTWGAGVIVPVDYNRTDQVAIAFTGQADAAANQSSAGRHFACSGITSLRFKFSEQVSTSAEVSLERDQGPEGHETHGLAALSTAWRPTKTLQFDVLAVAGLNRHSPDFRLMTGGAILF